ncbi:putative nuclease HARBI1 [Homalodisca vitripennis]|uniref:putative nuclease HARBI1 n=1 Tax=Homalodisca vitripennis TaxID=197043 RepID=UPI001EEA5B65|nr:putative nuclease HARBI1 [Homalodisca vitripennis]
MTEAKVLWQRHYRLPSVIGALDCTQIEIQKPGLHGDEYICRKGYPSINVQATCNALEQFTSISAEWPGSVHDGRVWRNSHVRDIVTEERVIIERCFGQLKRRFPILRNCVRVALNNIPQVVVSCAVLHNIAKYLKDDFEYGDLDSVPNEDDQPGVVRYENPDTTLRGKDKRANMMAYLNIQ